MFGFGKKRETLDDIVGRLRPDLSRESLGVTEAFPGVTPNPLLSPAAMRRNNELSQGSVAVGTLVDWREVSSDGSPRLVLMLDVTAPGGLAFRGIADLSMSITELTRLAAGQRFAVRYRPENLDHYVAIARDVDLVTAQRVVNGDEDA